MSSTAYTNPTLRLYAGLEELLTQNFAFDSVAAEYLCVLAQRMQSRLKINVQTLRNWFLAYQNYGHSDDAATQKIRDRKLKVIENLIKFLVFDLDRSLRYEKEEQEFVARWMEEYADDNQVIVHMFSEFHDRFCIIVTKKGAMVGCRDSSAQTLWGEQGDVHFNHYRPPE